MSGLKGLAAEALTKTALGSGLFVTPEDIDEAATVLAETIREAQAKALEDVGWQWFYPDADTRSVGVRLRAIGQGIRSGTHWEGQ